MGTTRRLPVLIVLLAVFLNLPKIGALDSDPIIDFETLPAGGQPVRVFDQFASLGILFNGPYAINYASGPFAIPGFTHSGTRAVEQCFAQEFCTTPIEVTFTRRQAHVRLWVGYSLPLSQARTVVLRAFDGDGAQITQVSTVLNPSSSAQSIQTPLELTLQTATIARVVLSFSSSAVLMNGLALDDVEFDTSGPPPPCPSTRPPTVSLTQPASGLTVDVNEFILQGSIGTDAPLTGATISATSSSGSRPLDLLSGGLVSRNGGTFGPVRINELLLPGGNTLTLTAENCLGTGQSHIVVTLEGLVVFGSEVNQGIPDYPLVSGKTTLVRAYIGTVFPGVPVRVDSAVLDVRAENTGATFSVNAAIPNPLFSNGNQQYTANDNVNFYLPGTAVAAEGRYSFSARLFRGSTLLRTVPFNNPYVFKRTDDLRMLVVAPDWIEYGRSLDEIVTFFDYINDLARILPVRDGVGEIGSANGLQVYFRIAEKLCDGRVFNRFPGCGPTLSEWVFDPWASFKWTLVQPDYTNGQRRTACKDNNGTIIPNATSSGVLSPLPCQFNPPFRYVDDGTGGFQTMLVPDAFLYFPGYAPNTADPTYDLNHNGRIDVSEIGGYVMEYSKDGGITWPTDLNRLQPGDIVHSFIDTNRNGRFEGGEPTSPFVQNNLLTYIWNHPSEILQTYNNQNPTRSKLHQAAYIIWSGMEHSGTAGGTGYRDGDGIGHLWAWLDGRPVLHQELGHGFGLVSSASPNFDGCCHSKNWYVPDPRNTRNPDPRAFDILRRRSIATALSVMFAAPGGSLTNKTYFNALLETAEYTTVFNELRNQLLTQPVAASNLFRRQWLLSGRLTREDHFDVVQSYSASGLRLTSTDPNSAYSLVFIGAGRRVLRQDHIPVSFETKAEQGHYGPDAYHDNTMVHVVRPLPDGTLAIEVRHDGRVLAHISRPPHRPQIRVHEVRGAKSSKGSPTETLTVSWDASHPDHAPLTYTVSYSADGGAFWEPLAVGITETSFKWDSRGVAGSHKALVQIEASDGFNTVRAATKEPFEVVPKPPLLGVISPANDEQLVPGRPVLLRGFAFDLQDGLLSGKQLRWSSDSQGELGSGDKQMADLKPGRHVLSLRATNSWGLESKVQVTVWVGSIGEQVR